MVQKKPQRRKHNHETFSTFFIVFSILGDLTCETCKI